MKEVILDFETANGVVDLATVGSTAYAKHWATEILSLVFDGHLWVPGNDGRTAISHGLLWGYAHDPETVFIAQNCGFEKDIWRYMMVPLFGFPDIPNERWHDIMAVAALRGLPLGLDKLLLALGLPGKDRVGSKLTTNLSQINKKTLYFDRRPVILQRVYQYNFKDYKDEEAVHQKLGYLPPKEHYVWLLDQEINERGLRFDLEMACGAMQIYKQTAPQMIEEFRQITSDFTEQHRGKTISGLTPFQVKKIKAWLETQGVVVDKLDKTTIAELLGDDEDEDHGKPSEWSPVLPDLPDNVRRALFLRSLVGSSSITKYGRMVAAADQSSHRIFRMLSYHGAGTGRWAGRLLNPHNMPRGIVRNPKGGNPDPEHLAAAIRRGNPQDIEALGLVKDDGTPAHVIEVLVSALRNTVVPAPGKKFLVSDYSNIEARLVLAFAGQRDKLDLIAAGKDPYLDMASQIYHRPVIKADVEMRQTGKNTVLGCGFQMGWPKFRERYCPKETPKFAKEVVDAYRTSWAPKVPRMWHGIQEAALAAVSSPGRMFAAFDMEYCVEGSWLVGHCPDGSFLYYYRPTLCRQKPRWKEITEDGSVIEVEGDWTDAWKYLSHHGQGHGPRGTLENNRHDRNQILGKEIWVHAYGGHLTENYIQHMARQLLCRSLHLCKQAGLQVVLHNHDEIVCEVDPHRKIEELQQIMEDRPEWAVKIHLPIATEAWEGTRYRK